MRPRPAPLALGLRLIAGVEDDRGCRAPSRGDGAEEALAGAVRAVGPPASATVIPAWPFHMGGEHAEGFRVIGEGPVREVEASAFRIDTPAVGNRRFAELGAETGHVTRSIVPAGAGERRRVVGRGG